MATKKKVLDPFCHDCVYCAGMIKACNYILVHKKSRGCPAGKGCPHKDTNQIEEFYNKLSTGREEVEIEREINRSALKSIEQEISNKRTIKY